LNNFNRLALVVGWFRSEGPVSGAGWLQWYLALSPCFSGTWKSAFKPFLRTAAPPSTQRHVARLVTRQRLFPEEQPILTPVDQQHGLRPVVRLTSFSTP